MQIWSSLVFLALAVVITLGLPRADEKEYAIPDVPRGSRAQYYVLHNDGTFKYGYDTGSGIYEMAKKLQDGNVNGYFGFTDPNGKNVRLDYTAGGTEGFVPIISGVNVSPNVLIKSATKSVPVAEKSYDDAPSDASYDFSYTNEDSSRAESSDANLNVKGSYSFVADDGIKRTVNYKAGSGTGFVAEGDFFPVAPESVSVSAAQAKPSVVLKSVPAPTEIDYSAKPDASYSFSYVNEDSSRREEADADLNVKGEYSFVADDGIRRTVNYKAGSDTGFIAEADFLPSAPEPLPLVKAVYAPLSVSSPVSAPVVVLKSSPASSEINYSVKPDASYSFSYVNEDSSRREEADADLNVKGEYSFVADDGVRRTVNYKAGSDTGFVAEADFLPVAPVNVPLTKAVYAPHPVNPPVSAPVVVLKSAPPPSEIDYSFKPDGSYSFSYVNEDSSRREEADTDLNVKGEYSFVADDGIRRTVNYKAGSDTGFIAEADFLPSAPEPLPLVKAVYAPLPVSSHVSAPVVVLKSSPASSEINYSVKPDASYSFSYVNEDSSRREEADADLNVKGEYSFVADDGVRRTVNYKAGSDTGFIAEADFLPVVPEPFPLTKSAYEPHSVSPRVPAPAVVLKSAPAPSEIEYSLKPDGSYSFSYVNEDSSRSEDADTNLNVKGKYSFVADDGVRRTVNYKAGSDTGFVAEADFLPEIPSPLPRRSAVSVPAVVRKSTSVPAEIKQSIQPDAGYSFSYVNEDSSRKESADSNLNIKGEYSFVADDGIRRTVNYKAGSDTGFVAEADFLPKSPQVDNIPDTKSAIQNVVPLVKSSKSFQKSETSHDFPFQQVVGNVLLRQYPSTHGSKYGYVFTEI